MCMLQSLFSLSSPTSIHKAEVGEHADGIFTHFLGSSFGQYFHQQLYGVRWASLVALRASLVHVVRIVQIPDGENNGTNVDADRLCGVLASLPS